VTDFSRRRDGATRLVRLALRAFPRRFRDAYGVEMEQEFAAVHAEVLAARGRLAAWRTALAAARSLVMSGLAERAGHIGRRALVPTTAAHRPRPEEPRMNAFVSDLRFGLRALRRRPAYAAVAIVTLAVGIGASTAMFGLANAVVFEPLPYPEPDRLVRFWDTNEPRGWRANPSSPANFADWREQQRSFTALAAFNTDDITYTGAEPAESWPAVLVSSEWTEVLRTPPALGRAFRRDEETFGNHRVVILSHGLWQRRFGGDSSIVGRTISLEGSPYTVVGVMPAGFAFPTPAAQLWAPLAYSYDVSGTRGVHFIDVIGRLRSDVTLSAASAEMDAVMQRLREAYPQPLEGWGVRLEPLHEAIVGDVRDRVLIFLGAVGLVLLVACVNVANLSAAHAVTRFRELAVRAAMGAGGWRLGRQLALEGMVVALLAGALGVGVAALTLRGVVAAAPGSIPRLDAVTVNPLAVAFATALSLVIGLLVGAIPALRAARRNLFPVLREGGRSASSGPGANRLRHAFVITQVTLAVVLAVCAGLLVKSFARLSEVDPGIRADRVLASTVSVPSSRYPDRFERGRFFLRLIERLERLPGVQSAAVATQLPLEGYSISFVYWVDGTAASLSERPSGDFRAVSHRYFETVGIRLLRGRAFTAADVRESPRVIVIDESLARATFGDADPVGRYLRLGMGDEDEEPRQIVGVVADVRQRRLSTPPRPGYYVPITQTPWSTVRVVVRSSLDATALAEGLRREVASLDPLIPVTNVATVADLVTRSVVAPRFNTLLLGVFAALALLLASAGIYSVLSYSVTQRTHDIGVRMALGADAGAVRRAVSRSALAIAGVGVCLGIAASLLLTPLMDTLLFEVGPRDPFSFAIPPLIFLGVAWLGSYIPARRASRVDPIIALRSE
jgi:putative ABC transport system permease protein